MKALKEKRISLRSLWRRGLVILSLFALVFASCSDSGGEAGSGDIVDYMEVDWATVPMQYQGRPVDLAGAQIKIHYTNTTRVDTMTNTSLMSTYPRVITGRYNLGTNQFEALRSYRIAWKGYWLSMPINFPAGKIQQIVRGDMQYGADWEVTAPSTEPIILRDWGIYANGLGTADTKLNNSKVFADAEKFDFSGLKLYAQYSDGAKLPIDLEKDVLWKIFPDYDDKNTGDDTCKGAVYVMVGADIEDYYADVPGYYRFGLTHREPLDVVYTVTDISYTKERDIEDFFFWQENTPREWGRRLAAAGVSLKINYTGGKSDTKNIADMIAKEDIWYNVNPGKGTSDLFITPLSYPFKTDKKDPNKGKILVYYRGAKKDAEGTAVAIEIPVFTKLVSLTIEGDNGDISLEAETADTITEPRDNDIGSSIHGSTEADLMKGLRVFATYQAFNVSGVTAEHNLTLAETRIAWGASFTGGTTYANGGFNTSGSPISILTQTMPTSGDYTTTTPTYPGFTGFTYNATTGTYSWPAAVRGRQAWGDYYVTNWDFIRDSMLTAGKSGKSKNVTILYRVDAGQALRHLGEAAIDQKYSYDGGHADFNVPFDGVTALNSGVPTLADFGVALSQSKSRKISVKWTMQ